MWIFIVGWKSLFWWFQANLACWCWDSMWKKVYKRLNPWINLMKLRPSDHCGWRSLQNSSQQELSSFKLLEIYFYPGPPGRAGENIFSICVSLMKNPGGVIAEQHTLEAVSKSQPLKHNGERALTPAVHCQIRPAITVPRKCDSPKCSLVELRSLAPYDAVASPIFSRQKHTPGRRDAKCRNL